MSRLATTQRERIAIAYHGSSTRSSTAMSPRKKKKVLATRARRPTRARIITELGRDFCFVGSQYPVQVGNHDFAIDLVFFHRGLQCLIAFELKVEKFKPEHLGQLNFYSAGGGTAIRTT